MSSKTTKTAGSVPAKTSQAYSEATDAAISMFGAFAALGRKSFEGVIEVDKSLLGYARDAVTSYVDLGRESVRAKSINDLFELYVAFGHSRIETNAANAREVVDLTKSKAEAAYAPVKDYFQAKSADKPA